MTPSEEHTDTIKLANHILNRVHADPDDDLAMLSRQFLRSIEARDRLAERVKVAEADNAALIEAAKGVLGWFDRHSVLTFEPREPHCDKLATAVNTDHPGTALTQRLAGMEEALRSLVEKLDTVHACERYKAVFTIAAQHGVMMSNRDPDYTIELKQARQALEAQ